MAAVPTEPGAHVSAQPSKSPKADPTEADHWPRRQPQVSDAAKKTVLSPTLPSKDERLRIEIESKVVPDW